jgi:hypothetical protein
LQLLFWLLFLLLLLLPLLVLVLLLLLLRRRLLLWLLVITRVLLLLLLQLPSFDSLRVQNICNVHNTTALPGTQWNHGWHILRLQLHELGRRHHLIVLKPSFFMTANPLPISRHLPQVRGSRPLQSCHPGVRQQGPRKWRPLRQGSTHSTYGLGGQLLILLR